MPQHSISMATACFCTFYKISNLNCFQVLRGSLRNCRDERGTHTATRLAVLFEATNKALACRFLVMQNHPLVCGHWESFVHGAFVHWNVVQYGQQADWRDRLPRKLFDCEADVFLVSNSEFFALNSPPSFHSAHSAACAALLNNCGGRKCGALCYKSTL